MREHEIAKIHVSVNSSATHIRAGMYRGIELFRAPKRETCVIRMKILICCGFNVAKSRKCRSLERPRASTKYEVLRKNANFKNTVREMEMFDNLIIQTAHEYV